MKILGRKILFVTAHPDDESYMAAGTMRKNNEAGGQSYIACATFGEKGKSHIRGKVTRRELKMLRKKELRAVSKFLKVSALLTPGLPDARMKELPNQEAFFEELLRFAEKHRPDLVISFDRDGISGHLDHISVGKVARRLARRLKIPFVAFSAPPGFNKYTKELKKRHKHGAYARRLKHKRHDFKIKVDASMKLKALRFHKSQLDAGDPFSGIAPRVVKQFLSGEYFALSGPRRP